MPDFPESDLSALPWYRHPWMWLVVGLPLLSVVASLIMVRIAVENRDDLVRDDWYKAGRAINQDLDAEHLARAMNLSAAATLDPAALVIHVSINNGASLPARLQLTLVHSTIASQDMTVLLDRRTDSSWSGTLSQLPLGKHHLMLEPLPADTAAGSEAKNRWRLRASDIIFQGAPIPLHPVG
ncbi:MAG: FixH family protein [Pseudomonadota bacterium]